MKKLRVLALVHEGLVPPESLEGYSEKEIDRWKVEFDVIATLRDIGHDVRVLGALDDLRPIRDAIQQFAPQVVFMLLEEFHGVAEYDQAVVSYLELLRQPYTGCNPRGLLLSRDKALSKKILQYHRIPTPRFAVFAKGKAVRLPRRLHFPLLVKSAVEDASLGISQASIVADPDALSERVQFIHEKVGTDAIAEDYIEGRELYVGVLGNDRLLALPVWELEFRNLPDDVAPIATAKVKWDAEYRKRHGIVPRAARNLPAGLSAKLARLCKRVYRALHLSGYARMDLRLRSDGQVFVIEANANPNLSYGEDFAESAHTGGIVYEALLERIMRLGLGYRAPWKG